MQKKAFDKLHYAVMMKTLSKLDIEGNFLTLLENIYKTHTNFILTYKLKLFSPRTGTRSGSSLHHCFSTLYWKVAHDRRQEKEVERYTVGEKGIKHSLFTDGTIACVAHLKELTTSTKKPSETSKRS